MSWREHWPDVKSSVEPGDVISGCRDNDTCTYRLFVNKGWREARVGDGLSIAHTFESRESCDLSIEDLRALHAVLTDAIAQHQPWPSPDEET